MDTPMDRWAMRKAAIEGTPPVVMRYPLRHNGLTAQQRHDLMVARMYLSVSTGATLVLIGIAVAILSGMVVIT